MPRCWFLGCGDRHFGLGEHCLDGVIDQRAHVVLVKPQAVGLAIEVGLASHRLGWAKARAESDGEYVGQLGSVREPHAAVVAHCVAVVVGAECQLPAVSVVPDTWLTVAAMSRVPLDTVTVPVLLRVPVAIVVVPVPVPLVPPRTMLPARVVVPPVMLMTALTGLLNMKNVTIMPQ